MSIYLREQSAGEILRGTIHIYFRHFLPLWGMYFLPIFPFALLKLGIFAAHAATPASVSASGAFSFLGWAEWFLVTPFAAAVLTGGVSDICIGNRPNIVRSLRQIFGAIFGKLVLTNLFTLLIEAAVVSVPIIVVWNISSDLGCSHLLLLFIPTLALVLVLLVWWMFVPTVIVLERAFGWTALKRSKALGKGFYLRNCGVVLLLYVPTYLLGKISIYLFFLQENDFLKILGVGFESALAPLPLIATVLLYYELRARSEGYDLAMLGQDLRR